MRYKVFSSIIALLSLIVLVSFLYRTFGGGFASVPDNSELEASLKAHAILLATELCYYDRFPGFDPTTTEVSPEMQATLEECSKTHLADISGDLSTQRMKVIKLIYEVAGQRPLRDEAGQGSVALGEQDRVNPFMQLGLDDATLVYHDIINCYMNMAIDIHMEFTLDKAKGQQDSNQNVDNKINDDNVYQITPAGPGYCKDLYDKVFYGDARLFPNDDQKLMSDFEDTLRTSLKDATSQDQGFVALMGSAALERYKEFTRYLQIRAQYVQDPLLPGFVYDTALNTEAALAQFSNVQDEISFQATTAQSALMASLDALSNFERTFAMHVQMRKMLYRSQAIKAQIDRTQFAVRQLNNKFTNASITGGKR